MDGELYTTAAPIKFGILPGKPGKLSLEYGFIAFTLGDGSLVFRAPLEEVRASFPKVMFFVGLLPLFGTGINMVVGRKTYRLWFVPFEYKLSRLRSVPGSGATWSASWGQQWSFSPKDVRRGRAAVRQWRAAFGQQTRPISWWDAVVMVWLPVLEIAAIVAFAVVIPPMSSDTSTSSAPSFAASGSPAAPASVLSWDQLNSGDCLQVPDVHDIPDLVTPVPCTQPHTVEVLFSGDIWPQSLAYPGDKAVANQAHARCVRAFTAYDGIPPDQSAFSLSEYVPRSDSWSLGNRSVQCSASVLQGTSIDHSIKGSGQ